MFFKWILLCLGSRALIYMLTCVHHFGYVLIKVYLIN